MHRMGRYSRECCDQVDGGPSKVWAMTIDRDGLEPAATRVLQEVQKELLEREALGVARDGPEHLAAFELYWAQRWCLNALLHLHGDKVAKQTQVQLANGRPLTICVGTGQPRPVTTILGTYYVTGGGCYRVFEDSHRPSARMFAHWCPDCRRRKTSRVRAEKRALTRRHAKIAKLFSDRAQNRL